MPTNSGTREIACGFQDSGHTGWQSSELCFKVKSDVEKELNFSEYEAAKDGLKDFGKRYGDELISLENEINDLSSSIDGSGESFSEEKIIRFHINSPGCPGGRKLSIKNKGKGQSENQAQVS